MCNLDFDTEKLVKSAAKAYLACNPENYENKDFLSGFLSQWCPDKSLDDALRLAIVLHLVVDVTPWCTHCYKWSESRDSGFMFRHDEFVGHNDSTLYAILHVAAKIGDAM